MNKEEEQECHFSINEYVSDEWLKTKQISAGGFSRLTAVNRYPALKITID